MQSYYAYEVRDGEGGVHVDADPDVVSVWALLMDDVLIAIDCGGVKDLKVGVVSAVSIDDAVEKVRCSEWDSMTRSLPENLQPPASVNENLERESK